MAGCMIACMAPSRLSNWILMNKFNFLSCFSKIWFSSHISNLGMSHSLGCARSTGMAHLLLLLWLVVIVILHLLLIEMQSDKWRGIIIWGVAGCPRILAVASSSPLIHVCCSQIWFLSWNRYRCPICSVCLVLRTPLSRGHLVYARVLTTRIAAWC